MFEDLRNHQRGKRQNIQARALNSVLAAGSRDRTYLKCKNYHKCVALPRSHGTSLFSLPITYKRSKPIVQIKGV